jgi:GT2 family glycosyltransferase
VAWHVASGDAVSVVIANWNGARYLDACLDAVDGQSLPAAEVVVVDNGSTDGSVDLLRRRHPRVGVLKRPENEGTSRAWNRAIRATAGDHILILNTDVFLDRDFLCLAVRAMQASGDVGLVAARIVDHASGRTENAGLALQRRLRVTNAGSEAPGASVFAGSGSALLCRRAMLEDIRLGPEYFDEAFFAYWEDIDLAWRAHLRGWRCVYEPRARARHVGSASQDGKVRVVDKSPFFQRHIWKNRYLTFVKNASPGVVLALAPWLILAELLSWPYLLLRAPGRLPVMLSARAQLIRLMPLALWKRRRIQARRRVGARRVLAHFVGF